jgi:hypothetical protein
MTTLEINQHPSLVIYADNQADLINELSLWKREDLINWLKWNDPNGVYEDTQSINEFNNIMSKEEGIEIIYRQIIEG